MMWYADNSELNGVRGAKIPDILLFGGIVVTPGEESVLRDAFETVKEKYGHPRAPVKWNFRDLKSLYEKQKQKRLYAQLLKSSKEWRREIVEKICESNVTILIACIESYSTRRRDIKRIKDGLPARRDIKLA